MPDVTPSAWLDMFMKHDIGVSHKSGMGADGDSGITSLLVLLLFGMSVVAWSSSISCSRGVCSCNVSGGGNGVGVVCEGLELVVSIGLSQNRTPSHRGRGVLVPLGNMVVVYGEIFS